MVRMEKIYDSPVIKTLIFSVFPFLAAIFTALYIGEISDGGKINWLMSLKSYSFYILLILTLIIFLYNRGFYKYERNLLQYSDPDFLISNIMKGCMPDILDFYREKIKGGNINELFITLPELRNSIRKSKNENIV